MAAVQRARGTVHRELEPRDAAHAEHDLLRARGFRVAVVGDHPYPGVPGGVVIRQNPQAGFQIAPGEAISLEVSR